MIVIMETLSSFNLYSGSALSFSGPDLELSVVESPVIGKSNLKRVTSTCKSKMTGKTLSVLVEDYQDQKLSSRFYEQYLPLKITVNELYEKNGDLISSETQRVNADSSLTKIIVRGSGKSSTTRIVCGEVEIRANERLVMIETSIANYNFHIFEGKWSSYYKELDLRLELKANFLKSPDETLKGPDGINLIFRKGRLVDLKLDAVCSQADSVT